MFSRHSQSYHLRGILLLSWVLVTATTSASAYERDNIVIDVLEAHAANKQRLLQEIREMSPLAVSQQFGMDFRELWRLILIDGNYEGRAKDEFLHSILRSCDSNSSSWRFLGALDNTHLKLFGFGKAADLMIRHASDPAFKPFGRHMMLAEALGDVSRLSSGEVQAFQTIFETGQNTRGYVHKLECHGEAVEYVYAVTDIVYGVMLPSDLEFDPNGVIAYPERVRMFYVRAGEVIALRPYVLHSGALSVEPDRGFSVVIYKKPVPENERRKSYPPLFAEILVHVPAQLPEQWQQKQDWLKIAGIDKYCLTLAELHTDDLKTNRGFIADKRPIRLPTWK